MRRDRAGAGRLPRQARRRHLHRERRIRRRAAVHAGAGADGAGARRRVPLEHGGRVADGAKATRSTGVRCVNEEHRKEILRRRRLRDGARQLQPVPAAAARRAVPHLSGQGLLGDDRHRRPPRRADRVADRPRLEDRVHAPGRPAARRRHRGAVRLHEGPEPRPLRRAGQAHVRAVPRRRRPRERRSSGPACAPPRRRTCRCWAARATATCSSTPATARWAGRWPAARGARCPT